MLKEAGYPVGVACTVLALSHSSYYYHPEKKDERELEEAIEEIAGEFPKYGTRRVSQQFRRSPHKLSVGRKRVRRLMAQKNLLRPVKQRKKRTTDSEHPYPRYPNLVKKLEITHPDQVWAVISPTSLTGWLCLSCCCSGHIHTGYSRLVSGLDVRPGIIFGGLAQCPDNWRSRDPSQ